MKRGDELFAIVQSEYTKAGTLLLSLRLHVLHPSFLLRQVLELKPGEEPKAEPKEEAESAAPASKKSSKKSSKKGGDDVSVPY